MRKILTSIWNKISRMSTNVKNEVLIIDGMKVAKVHKNEPLPAYLFRASKNKKIAEEAYGLTVMDVPIKTVDLLKFVAAKNYGKEIVAGKIKSDYLEIQAENRKGQMKSHAQMKVLAEARQREILSKRKEIQNQLSCIGDNLI